MERYYVLITLRESSAATGVEVAERIRSFDGITSADAVVSTSLDVIAVVEVHGDDAHTRAMSKIRAGPEVRRAVVCPVSAH